MKTIVRICFGSHLYGTDTPESDLDFKSVFIPDAEAILLQRVQNVYRDCREKKPGEKNLAGEAEEEFYSLQKFLHLLAEGQTNAIDMIFAPREMLLQSTPLWDYIVTNRHRLLTRRAAAFTGYCRQQANKYGIRGSRVAATRGLVKLLEGLVRRHGTTAKVQECAGVIGAYATTTDHCAIIELESPHGGPVIKHLECCNRKAPYTITLKDAHAIYKRLFDEYGERARKAEKNEGIDWKALSHAVRVGREALDLLAGREIIFPLPYREHVKEIKCGLRPYAEVADEIESLLVEVEKASETSSLPLDPDREWIDVVVKEAYRQEIVMEISP